MLGRTTATATVAVRDMKRAKSFYEGVLGLSPVHVEDGEAVSYQTGNSELLVYHSSFAGTNQASAVTWMIDQGLEDLVNQLKAKGVKFEHYDMPGTKRQGEVHQAGNTRAAWFKDPDGNIHALVSQ